MFVGHSHVTVLCIYIYYIYGLYNVTYIYIWVIDIFTKHLLLQLDESAVIGSPSQRHDQKPQSAESMLLRSKESGVPPRHLEMDRNEMTRPGMNIHQAAVLEYPRYQGFDP